MNKPDYITTTHGGSGYFAVFCRWYADIDGYDAYQTGNGRYATKTEAEAEGREWAEAEGIEFQ